MPAAPRRLTVSAMLDAVQSPARSRHRAGGIPSARASRACPDRERPARRAPSRTGWTLRPISSITPACSSDVGEVAAAHHDDVLAGLRLQLAHELAGVGRHQLRALARNARQRAREHIGLAVRRPASRRRRPAPCENSHVLRPIRMVSVVAHDFAHDLLDVLAEVQPVDGAVLAREDSRPGCTRRRKSPCDVP